MQQIDVSELQDLVATLGGSPPAMLLDVREQWELAFGQIQVPGAAHLAIPMNALAQRIDELDRAQPVICICHHGMRSAQVAAFLERQGFEAVYNLRGGTDAWSAQVDAQLPRY